MVPIGEQVGSNKSRKYRYQELAPEDDLTCRPFLTHADAPVPNSLIYPAMIAIARCLAEMPKRALQFKSLVNSLRGAHGRAELDLAIRRHFTQKRVRLVARSYDAVVKVTDVFGEEHEIDEPIEEVFVVANNSLFGWWDQQTPGSPSQAAPEPEDGPVASEPRAFWWKGSLYTLTKRNSQILRVLWKNPNGVRFSDLDLEVWGQEKSHTTIKSQISRLNTQLVDHGIDLSAFIIDEVVRLRVAD